MASTTEEPPKQPWFAAFPAPRTTQPGAITRDDVLSLIRAGEAGKTFILVDLRMNDFVGGSIQGSINVPAGAIYPTLPAMYQLFKSAGLKKVIFFCGSSKGRGTRAAGWFNDFLEEKGDTSIESLILLDGIKGWATGGAEFVGAMDGYVAEAWGNGS